MSTALSAGRMYRSTVLLLALTAAVCVSALAPVATLMGAGTGTLATRLRAADAEMALTDLPVATPALTPLGLRQAGTADLFGLLAAAGAAVLLTATITLLVLFFARASARAGEVGIRRAVGASRRLLLTAALLEGLAIMTAALAAGALVGAPAGALAASTWPGALAAMTWTPALAALTMLAVVLLGGAELPTLVARPERIVEAEATPVAFFLPALLQLALCLITLTAGALLTRHVRLATQPGADPAPPGLLYPLENPATDAGARAARYEGLLERLEDTPASAVSLTAPGTAVGLGPVARITTNCGHCYEGGIYLPLKRPLATHHFVSPDTFRTLGIRVIAGRGITREDRWQAPGIAVVNRALAERHFQDGDAIGRELQVGDMRDRWFRVVGVVEDAPPSAMGAGKLPPSTVYLSILQAPPAAAELLVRDLDPAGLTTALPAPLRAGAPRALAAARTAEVAPLTWFGRWTQVEGWAMVLLAAIGIFAFARLWVVSLLPELGVRRAAGARRHQILTLVLGRAAGVGAVGVALGAWFGPAAWLTLPALLPGLPEWDTGILLAHGAVLVLLMMAGTLFPLWQAIHDPPAELLSGAAG